MSTTITEQDIKQPVQVEDVAGYGNGSPEASKKELEAESSSLQPTPTKVYPAGTTAVLASASTSSLGGAKPIPSNRQTDFEKLFGHQIQPPKGEDTPDFYTVCQTQSADLQSSVLLHGRLYLTRYHICFRSNICGYVTEKIHDLRDVVAVEKSTTAKWIQNAVSLTLDTTSDEKVVGYGSMGDREAMYAGVMELWKLRAPERWNTFMENKDVESDDDADLAQDSAVVGEKRSVAKSKRNRSATTSTQSGSNRTADVDGRHRAMTAAGELGHGVDGTSKSTGTAIAEEDDAAQETECSGEHFDEVALDTTLPVQIDQLYNLMYHNPEFGRDFLEVKQKLTDLDVGDFQDKDGAKERSLKYVMHMNNYIGPKKSDCIGLERVEVEKPAEVYEIVSETQTPDVPSGKSFKIHTRTCLTKAIVDGTPGTRMYCTTQCDWSASSMLKSTITPAVIKGQKEYHQKWLAALKEWIDAHPDDFEAPVASEAAGGDTTPKTTPKADPTEKVNKAPIKEVSAKSETSTKTEVDSGPTLSIAQRVTGVADDQMILTLAITCLLSMVLNYYLLTRGSPFVKAISVAVVPQ